MAKDAHLYLRNSEVAYLTDLILRDHAMPDSLAQKVADLHVTKEKTAKYLATVEADTNRAAIDRASTLAARKPPRALRDRTG